MEVYVGILDTRNFNFFCVSDSEETLMSNFRLAWEEHKNVFYDACDFSDVEDSINIMKVPMNSVVRDYEVILDGNQKTFSI